MTDKSRVLKALKYLSKLPTFKELSEESGVDATVITRAVKGDRSLTDEQVEKLLPVLKNRKLIK